MSDNITDTGQAADYMIADLTKREVLEVNYARSKINNKSAAFVHMCLEDNHNNDKDLIDTTADELDEILSSIAYGVLSWSYRRLPHASIPVRLTDQRSNLPTTAVTQTTHGSA